MGRRIKILHVAQVAGGVDRYIRMLFKYMDHDRFENILVCSYDFKREDYNGLADGFEYVDMDRAIGGKDLKAMKAVCGLIRKYNPDIIYAHSSKAGAVARVANLGLKNRNGQHYPLIYNSHGWAFDMKNDKAGLYEKIEKIAAPFCDKIICISEYEKQSALEKKICKADKLQVIVNGIDIEEYEQRKAAGLNEVSCESLGIPSDAFIVGMVGRITKQKAPDVFIKAAKQIKQKILEAYFIIVGDGAYQNRVEEYAAKHGLVDSLLITGWVENASYYIDLFDVALLLSRWEGFGLAIPEYMLAGKPVVATRVDAIPEIVEDSVNGLLVDVEDVIGVCDAMMKLYEDSGLRISLINKVQIVVNEKYNAKRVSRKTESFLLEIMD